MPNTYNGISQCLVVESARCLQPISRVGHSVPIVFLDVLLLRMRALSTSLFVPYVSLPHVILSTVDVSIILCSGFPSTRINLSPFTKDFRGGEQLNESIN